MRVHALVRGRAETVTEDSCHSSEEWGKYTVSSAPSLISATGTRLPSIWQDDWPMWILAMSAMGASWSGTISDSMCGAKHAAATADDQKCAATCVKEHGAEPVFLVGDKVYTLDTSDKATLDTLDKLAAAKATVKGEADGDTIKVASVTAAK